MKILLFILIVSLLSCTKEKIIYKDKVVHDTVYINKYIPSGDTLYIDRYEMLSFYKDSIIAEYKGLDTNGNVKMYDYYYTVYKFLDFNLDGKVDTTDFKQLKKVIK